MKPGKGFSKSDSAWPEIIVPVVAAAIYVLISLVNHFVYRTYFNDLGLYTNAMYNYAHGNWDKSLIIAGGEHIDLWLLIFSPLSYLFGSYTLLIFQIVLVIAGGVGVRKYILQISENRLLSILAQVHFYFSFGLFTALSFDYHSNVCAAMLIPWLFIFVKQEKWIGASVIFFLIIVAKENMPLWMMFVCSGMLFSLHRLHLGRGKYKLPHLIIPDPHKNSAKVLLVFVFVATAYFLFLSQWFMPRYSYAVIGHLKDYHILGTTPLSAIENIFTHPFEVLKMFFTNHVNVAGGDFLKAEFHMFLLFSGGWILLIRPQYLWMCIPVFAQKLLTDNPQFWGVGGQYAIEFVPIISIGIFEFLSLKISRQSTTEKAGLIRWKRIKTIAIASVLITVVTTFRMLDYSHAFIDRAAIRFYQQRHYTAHLSMDSAGDAIDLIPQDAALSAQTHLAPHAALRKSIYLFPEINDADYILLQLNGNSFYPLTQEELISRKEYLIKSGSWNEVWQKDSIVILRRNK